MAQVTIKLNGYTHTIGCQDGEEDHVRSLAAQMEEKVRTIRAMGGQFSESRMLLHVALLLADEAHDLRVDLQRLRNGQGPVQAAPAPAPLPPVAPQPDPRVAERLERLALRIEDMAKGLG